MPSGKSAASKRLISIGSSPPHEYSLDKPTIAIGSHPKNDVVLDDTTVSRRHATITRKPGGFELADLGSTNGTFVNGSQVRKPISLKSGDEIKFGSVRMAFDPAGVPSRMRRGLAILTVMFIVGFAVARYRDIGPALSAIATRLSSRQVSSEPSAANTQSASTDAESTVATMPASPAIPESGGPEW